MRLSSLFLITALFSFFQTFVVVILVNNSVFTLSFFHFVLQKWTEDVKMRSLFPCLPVKKCGNHASWPSVWIFATRGQSVKFLMSSVCRNFSRKSLLVLASSPQLHLHSWTDGKVSWRGVFMAPCGSDTGIFSITHRSVKSSKRVWNVRLLRYQSGIKGFNTSPATAQLAVCFFCYFFCYFLNQLNVKGGAQNNLSPQTSSSSTCPSDCRSSFSKSIEFRKGRINQNMWLLI